jgi:hypothetical protein
MSVDTSENSSTSFDRAEQPAMSSGQRSMHAAAENSFPLCMCSYSESGGCLRYAVVNQKFCLLCLEEETNWACACECAGCPTSHEAAVATKVEALPCAVSFQTVLEEVEEAHCLIALSLGPDFGLDGLQFPEVYMLRRTSRRVRQISYYDVHWLRACCWECVCEGEFEHGAGCSMEWRKQGWICPLLFRCL